MNADKWLAGGVRFFVGDSVWMAPWLPTTSAGEHGVVTRVVRYQIAEEVTVELDNGTRLTVPPCELEWAYG